VALRAYFDLRNESRKSVLLLQQPDLLDRLTRVILLANPAHQTALNSRKKLIQNNAVEPHWELSFSGSLLSCRECAKESILWHHRKWLLHAIHGNPSTAGTDAIPETISHRALEAEFACASTACHLYPRNYHAWTHRNSCAKALIAPRHPGAPSNSGVLAEEYRRTLKWIETHVSDYSAMNYAINFESMLADGEPTDGYLSTVDHALSLLWSYPDYESLWMYLRGSETVGDKKELFSSMREAPSARKYVQRYIVSRKIFVSPSFTAPVVYLLKQRNSGGKRFRSSCYVIRSPVIFPQKSLSNQNLQTEKLTPLNSECTSSAVNRPYLRVSVVNCKYEYVNETMKRG
jgi:hypothetical protein